jgi:hypothetical protein
MGYDDYKEIVGVARKICGCPKCVPRPWEDSTEDMIVPADVVIETPTSCVVGTVLKDMLKDDE